jgi:hypothetical protein
MTTVRANRPDVVDEEFDGEALLVQLRTGRYHALDVRASAVWASLGSATVAVDELVAEHGEHATTVLAALLAEQLVVVDGPMEPAAATSGSGIQTFSDMEDLLLLDPIHDVDLDGTGWPVRPEGM